MGINYIPTPSPAYDRMGEWGFDDDVALMISDDPIDVTISRTIVPDLVKGDQVELAFGPFTGTIAAIRQSRVAPTYDEKGTTARHPHIFLSINIPLTTVIDGETHRTIQLDDRLTDADGNQYTVTSVLRKSIRVEVNMELRT